MPKGDVEYFWEYNMITGGESTTERCVAGMIQNDYIYRKMMYVCIELRLAQDVILNLVYSISWMPCMMVGKNISQNIIWFEAVLLD